MGWLKRRRERREAQSDEAFRRAYDARPACAECGEKPFHFGSWGEPKATRHKKGCSQA